jgi:hypothetical protein
MPRRKKLSFNTPRTSTKPKKIKPWLIGYLKEEKEVNKPAISKKTERKKPVKKKQDMKRSIIL